MYTLYQNDINLGNMLRMAILGQTLIWQGLTHFFVTLWDCIKIYIGSEPAMGAAAFQNKVIDELAVLYLEHAPKVPERESILRTIVRSWPGSRPILPPVTFMALISTGMPWNSAKLHCG